MEIISSTPLSLTDLMMNIRLSPRSSLPYDRILTEAQMMKIYDVLFDDMTMVIQSFSATPQIIKLTMERLLINVVLEARRPYVDAAEEVRKETEQARKETEQALRETEQARKETEQALRETKQARKETEQARKETEQALRETKQARKETEQALRETEQARKETEQALRETKQARKETEQALKETKQSRKETKQSRKETEEARKSTEEARKATEEARKVAEEVREYSRTEQQKATAKIEALLTEKYKLLLERNMDRQDSVPVSVNRAQTWMKVLDKNPGRQDLDIPALPKGTMIEDPEIQDLQNGNYARESDMYKLFLSHAQKYFNMDRTECSPGAKIWDTHHSRNLNGRSPDFTITVANTSSPDPYSIIAMWEMKLGTLDDDAKGQMYDYLKIVSSKQPQRQKFVGILSNFNENIVITLTRANSGKKLETSSYKSMTTEYAISYLRETIKNTKYHPPIPAFSIELGIMQRRLGNQAFSEVAVFITPRNLRKFANGRWINPLVTHGDGKRTIVVKRNVPARGSTGPRLVHSEIKILQLIQKLGGHRNLPQLFYYSLDYEEFGIEPLGCPIKPGDIFFDWRHILTDVLSALRWLHSKHIIHRDVRWDNIIWERDRAVLLDLGAAVHCLPSQPTSCQYEGGYICCPPRLLGQFDEMYLPDAADDCHAFILLVNMLCWPERWKDLRTDCIASPYSDVTLKLMGFWADARVSSVWGKYVIAAEAANYNALEEMLELCLYFGAPTVVT